MLTIKSRYKKRIGKGAKVVIPLLSGMFLLGSMVSAAQNAADDMMTTGSEKTLNCVCSAEPKDDSALLDQQTCGPHPKKDDGDNLTYDERG